MSLNIAVIEYVWYKKCTELLPETISAVVTRWRSPPLTPRTAAFPTNVSNTPRRPSRCKVNSKGRFTPPISFCNASICGEENTSNSELEKDHWRQVMKNRDLKHAHLFSAFTEPLGIVGIMACTSICKLAGLSNSECRQVPVRLGDISSKTPHLQRFDRFLIVRHWPFQGCHLVQKKPSSHCFMQTALPCHSIFPVRTMLVFHISSIYISPLNAR